MHGVAVSALLATALTQVTAEIAKPSFKVRDFVFLSALDANLV
jgi:hypothetical protein